MRAGALTVDEGLLETGWWGPGPTEAPTVVLLHEGLGCVELWRDVPERLAATTGWGVFAYSRFGYGWSDLIALPRPMNYMQHEAVVVLPQVLRETKIEQAVLLGHSDGGSIAAIYAGATGHQSAALAGAVAGGQQGSAFPGAFPRTSLRGLVTVAAHFFVEDLNLASIREIRSAYEEGGLRERLARYHRDVDVAFRGWNDAWLDPRFRDFDITGYLPSIGVPILGLQGANDPYGTDEQLRVLRAQARAPIDIELIAGARHAPHLEAKETALAAITRFISGLPRDFGHE